MSYFVVERNGDGGGLRIPLPTAFETREAAIAALSAATGSGEVILTGEVFIADLGSAVPVLVMAAAPPVASAPEPEVEAEPEVEPEGEAEPEVEPEVEAEPEPEVEVEVFESTSGDFIIEDALPEPAELDEASAEAAYTTWEPLADEAPEASTLADALKRAAISLEDEGVVAPDSVISEMTAHETPLEDADEAETMLAEPPLADAAEPETTSEWPWANIEAYEVSADAAESDEESLEPEADIVVEVAEPASVSAPEIGIAELVESLGGDAPIITSAPPEGEEAYVPRPVILGDYADSAEPGAETEDPFAVVEVPEVAAVEVPEVAESLEPAADASQVSLDGGYAPAGVLDLGEYTCQDCVYSNTCPKVGQVTPAECGSFQWKSE